MFQFQIGPIGSVRMKKSDATHSRFNSRLVRLVASEADIETVAATGFNSRLVRLVGIRGQRPGCRGLFQFQIGAIGSNI